MPELADASIDSATPGLLRLSGRWTLGHMATAEAQLQSLGPAPASGWVIDGAGLTEIDSVGVWTLQQVRGAAGGSPPQLTNWPERWRRLMEQVAEHSQQTPPQPPQEALLVRTGASVYAAWQELHALLAFVGECAVEACRLLPRPRDWRWRAVLREIQIGGWHALAIVGLTAFLLGIVVAYQGADQLKLYGASIYVVDLVGFAMLREFAPLITAIIIAGRSGSAYAAQIGTMRVTEEIDALRTLGIPPLDLLVLPKIVALLISLPLLTVYADIVGIVGAMVMAQSQLDISYVEFLERFGRQIDLSIYLMGVGKAFVFAFIIAIVGCFQGFRTEGNADSVGRQTTRAVVQSIFLVIVADAVFSVLFSVLDL